MRYLKGGRSVVPEGRWDPMTGPFGTLGQAESYLDSPPEGLGDPGTVTLEKLPEGFVVFTLHEKPREESRVAA